MPEMLVNISDEVGRFFRIHKDAEKLDWDGSDLFVYLSGTPYSAVVLKGYLKDDLDELKSVLVDRQSRAKTWWP